MLILELLAYLFWSLAVFDPMKLRCLRSTSRVLARWDKSMIHGWYTKHYFPQRLVLIRWMLVYVEVHTRVNPAACASAELNYCRPESDLE